MVLYSFIVIVALLYLLFNIYVFLREIVYPKILLPCIKSPVDLKSMGRWAVVTGCTDGIGKAFAIELAKIGLDIVLISRSQQKLEDLAGDLKMNYDVKTKIVVADFTNTEKAMKNIKHEISDLDIGVLVNNVGVSAGTALFLNNNQEEVNNMVEVNIKSTVKMSHIVMPIMLMKRKGVVINVSSLSAILPSPNFTCYGATKAFMYKFSRDLSIEYKNKGIIVHCLTSGFVATKMTNLPKVKWFLPTPTEYVKSAIKTIGLGDVTTGHSAHDLFEFGLKCLYQISPTFTSSLLNNSYNELKNYVHAPSTAQQQITINGNNNS